MKMFILLYTIWNELVSLLELFLYTGIQSNQQHLISYKLKEHAINYLVSFLIENTFSLETHWDDWKPEKNTLCID